MLHIPLLRFGEPYKSLDVVTIRDHVTGGPVAELSQANTGLIAHDLNKIERGWNALQEFNVCDLIAICQKAAGYFMNAKLPLGDTTQTPQDFVRFQSATTGLPQALCCSNMDKVAGAMEQMESVLSGLTRGLDLSILDAGFGEEHGRLISYFPVGNSFGAVLPSNSPGVHTLWSPAFALKYPLVLKPGRDEPWTPYRVIQALIKAGAPDEAFCYLPCDHAGAGEILRRTSRSMLFGDVSTTKLWAHDPRVQLHGPGWSKVVLGADEAPNWQKYLDVMATSIAANGGRSCINASGVWTPAHSREIADALAKKLAKIKALPPDDPNAALAAFTNPKAAEMFSGMIDDSLKTPGAEDVTARYRRGSRVATIGKSAFLQPTIIHCDSPDHPLANKEFLFPFASVVACPQDKIVERMGPSLVVTAITKDQRFIQSLMESPHVDRLNIGAIPTPHIAWNQPHEGNLFDHLYKQRAFQTTAVG